MLGLVHFCLPRSVVLAIKSPVKCKQMQKKPQKPTTNVIHMAQTLYFKSSEVINLYEEKTEKSLTIFPFAEMLYFFG